MMSIGNKPKGPSLRMALFIKLALGGTLLAFLVAISDRHAVVQVLGQLNGWVILSLLIFYVHSAIRAWRWNLFLRAQDIHVPFLQANRIYLSGSFLGLLSPGRIGELYRVWLLYHEKKVRPGIGIASVLVDRLVDVVTLLSIGFLGFFYLAQQGLGSTAPALAWPAFFLRGRSLLGRFLRRQFQRLLDRMPEKVAREVPEEYRHFVQSLGRMSGRLLLQLVALTLVCIALYCGHLYFVARVLGLPLSFWEVTGVLCAATFVNLIPISLNGIGTRDAFLVATLPILGVAPAEALGFSLFFLLLFLANTLMAFPFWLYGRSRNSGT